MQYPYPSNLAGLRTLLCLGLISLTHALWAQPVTDVKIDTDGSVHMPAQSVPVSEFLSPEGKAYLAEHLVGMTNPDSQKLVNGVPALIAGYLDRQRELFPVQKEDTTIGAVHAVIYQPADGIPPENRDKVLINLHGGGFSGCWLGCAELESLPIAHLGRIKVVSLDYRQGPDYRFPAASEDVAAAYRELLKTYRPENIGIYGCSAGGMLTGMAVAWFQQHDLPRPGAIGILCAGVAPTGAAFGGDANYFTMPMGEGRVLPPPSANSNDSIVGGLGYFAGTDPRNPLIAPTSDPAVLAKFPPTMIVSATRGFELSNAVYTHIQLAKLDVPAELYVWEGMFHGFFYNPDVPESRECFDLIIKFFNKWLGKA